MRAVLGAVVAGLKAPLKRAPLVFLLWIARLFPAILVIGLSVHQQARAVSAADPDARMLLDSPDRSSGYLFAWTGDFLRYHFTDVQERLFWLVAIGWIGVTVLSGGIVSRLVGHQEERRPFWEECGRLAPRFLRLGLLFLLLFYAADAAINTFMEMGHADQVRVSHTQHDHLKFELWRGLLFLSVVYLLGLVHSYSRISMVARNRKSALVAMLCGLGTLVGRLPKLFLLEGLMLIASALAMGFMWFVLRHSGLIHRDAGWVSIGLFLGLAALASYLRTGVELGAVDARCRLLVPPDAAAAPVAEPAPPEVPDPEPEAADAQTGAEWLGVSENGPS